MDYHIVLPGEKLEDIAGLYNLSKEEIKSANPQFRSWENLAPGVKLKLPAIPEYIETELELVEPFIEDYYPTIDVDEIKQKHQMEEEVIPVSNFEKPKESIKTKPKYGYYMPYYYPYFGDYTRYYPRRKR